MDKRSTHFTTFEVGKESKLKWGLESQNQNREKERMSLQYFVLLSPDERQINKRQTVSNDAIFSFLTYVTASIFIFFLVSTGPKNWHFVGKIIVFQESKTLSSCFSFLLI